MRNFVVGFVVAALAVTAFLFAVGPKQPCPCPACPTCPVCPR